MGLYAGCDLHAKSNYWGVVDGEGRRVFKKKVGNEGEKILEMLKRFGGGSRVDLQLVLVGGSFDGRGVSGAFGESGEDAEVWGVEVWG